MIKELAKKNRSYRKFYSEYRISIDDLLDFIETSRYSASAANKQLIRYFISNNPACNDTIFSTLRWAGYLNDWNGPNNEEKPSAYIVLLSPIEKNEYVYYDAGLVSQLILLSAVEKGLGGCMFGSVDRDLLKKHLKIDTDIEIISVIALGKPKENIVINNIRENESIKYYRKEGSHFVPKIITKDLVINYNQVISERKMT